MIDEFEHIDWEAFERESLDCPVLYRIRALRHARGWTRIETAIAAALYLSRQNRKQLQAESERLSGFGIQP